MADNVVDLTKQTKLPSQIAAALAAQNVPDDPNIAQASSPDYAVPDALAKLINSTPNLSPDKQPEPASPEQAASPDYPVPGPIKAAIKTPDLVSPPNVPPPAPIMDTLGSSKTAEDVGSLAAQPPKVDVHQSLGQKIVSHIPQVLMAAGVLGGGMEAAGSPGHEAPNAARFQGAMEAEANRAIQNRQVDIAKQKADTEEAYKDAVQKQYGVTQVGTNPDGTPRYVLNKDLGKLQGTLATNESRENVASGKNETALKIEQLRQGAPMMITPEMADLAQQPQLAGKAVTGATLKNFVQALHSHGASIKDLGADPQHPGMWVVDNAGRFLHQVTTVSPALERAAAVRQAVVNDVYDNDGNLRPMTDAQRLKAGLPKAQTEFSEQGPTVDMRNKGAIADRAAQAGNRVLQDLQDPKIRSLIGVAMGKAANWEDFLGMLPPELGETTQDLKSFSQFVGGQHPVRGLNALEAFEKAIGGIGQNPDTLASKIGAQMKTSDFISNQAKFKPSRGPGGNGNGTATNPKITPAGGGTNTPPPPAPNTPHSINYNGKKYVYKGSGDTADINNYSPVQ